MSSDRDRKKDEAPIPARRDTDRPIERKHEYDNGRYIDRGPSQGNPTTVNERNPIPDKSTDE